jgi:hypothetical protein
MGTDNLIFLENREPGWSNDKSNCCGLRVARSFFQPATRNSQLVTRTYHLIFNIVIPIPS